MACCMSKLAIFPTRSDQVVLKSGAHSQTRLAEIGEFTPWSVMPAFGQSDVKMTEFRTGHFQTLHVA